MEEAQVPPAAVWPRELTVVGARRAPAGRLRRCRWTGPPATGTRTRAGTCPRTGAGAAGAGRGPWGRVPDG
ncbi:hypothetical protein ACWFQ8_13710 [Streptomyces sp. NPDC055254]